MFRKLVAIEPVSLVQKAELELSQYAEEIIYFQDIPSDNEEIIKRIGDADGVLLSYTSKIDRYVLEHTPNLRYVGMCCSLYSEESANVDIVCAREKGIVVRGIRDYGDRGVVEYVLSELVRFLHGFDRPLWGEIPVEITGLKIGIIGLGVSGTMVGQALQFMGGEVSYYSRTRKQQCEDLGMRYLPLHELLENSSVIITCLNKNVFLLGEEEFRRLGNHKILFNTSIGPAFQSKDLKAWIESGDNYFVCDTQGAIGDEFGQLLNHPRVFCAGVSAGRTSQAFDLLSEKVLENIKEFLN